MSELELSFCIICKTGYGGSSCELNISSCDDNVCESERVCTVNTCRPGYVYTDVNCSTVIPPCEPGYTGANCTTPITSCEPGYTGANCTTAISSCDPGYTGTNCTTPIAPCEPGYTGSDCETPLTIDLCNGINCSGNGECTQNGTQAFCNCLPGFMGDSCEAPINGYELQVTVDSYSNPRNLCAGCNTMRCCDVVCSRGCDVYFNLCTRPYLSPTPTDTTIFGGVCSSNAVKTETDLNSNGSVLSDTFLGIPNPILLRDIPSVSKPFALSLFYIGVELGGGGGGGGMYVNVREAQVFCKGQFLRGKCNCASEITQIEIKQA